MSQCLKCFWVGKRDSDDCEHTEQVFSTAVPVEEPEEKGQE